MEFNYWLANLFGQNTSQIRILLENKTATNFLVCWSIYETNCFNCFAKQKDLADFSKILCERTEFNLELIEPLSTYFHKRYQNKQYMNNLLHNSKYENFEKIISKDICTLSPYDHVLLVVYVIYRFRNNIFHGNKGVKSWLKYEQQIKKCIEIMQAIINIQNISYKDAFNQKIE